MYEVTPVSRPMSNLSRVIYGHVYPLVLRATDVESYRTWAGTDAGTNWYFRVREIHVSHIANWFRNYTYMYTYLMASRRQPLAEVGRAIRISSLSHKVH
jgi:hypothetical protein